MLYRINDLTVFLGGNEILSHLDLEIRGTEKIAVTGRNGAGKTTLLRFIAGELEAERDDKRTAPVVETARALSIGYLKQTAAADAGRTIGEICLSDCPESEEWEFDRLFTGFGFAKEDKDKRLKEFSGGEQTKISMIRLLLTKPDILLLDEPTNHLDIKAVEWLEEYLKHYEKAVVFVTHDRFFTDRVAEAVVEIERKKAVRYAGNYTRYRREKLKRYEADMKVWERSEREIRRLEGLIRRFKNTGKAAFAESRKSILKRMERPEKPHWDSSHIFVKPIEPKNAGAKWVLDAEHLKCGYKDPVVELSIKLQRGSKVAILGDNGAGKSTFLKTVAGLLRPLEGKCTIGNRVEIGYFDQLSAQIDSELSVFEHFAGRFPGMLEKEVRTTLASYLFGGANAHKKVNSLSGGEKARLVLAELLTAAPNFLILDEPTNHMDIEACETLESAFRAYKGTILFVSHDRYLIGRLADSFYIFEDGRALFYPFDYAHYLERLERLATARRINVNTGIPEMKPSSAKDIQSEITGLVSAEDAAMIAKLKAVPKKERHEIGFANETEAYNDWQLRMAEEALEAARQKLEDADDFDSYEAALNGLSEEEISWYDAYSVSIL
ncbi:MAG: ABC-F family ATP-binding cassette domain-containing protein [Lachnospiraceae bacterium]|nr:ABC-F family ATP-binding cassette domain-containing protein [Lachnospiraceae bacterium]